MLPIKGLAYRFVGDTQMGLMTLRNLPKTNPRPIDLARYRDFGAHEVWRFDGALIKKGRAATTRGMAHILVRCFATQVALTACAALAHGQTVNDGATPGWHATYDAAEAKVLGCVQSHRSPSWAEFAEPPGGPPNEPPYSTWSNRFMSASLAVSELCQRQEPKAATALCELMQFKGPQCGAWLLALVGDVMNEERFATPRTVYRKGQDNLEAISPKLSGNKRSAGTRLTLSMPSRLPTPSCDKTRLYIESSQRERSH
jgi:hypothetical protein